jgi:hypothetical protein
VVDNEAIRQQRERASRASSRAELRKELGIPNLTTNPLLGLDPFEAESYMLYAPEKSYERPVKSPRYVDPRMDSPDQQLLRQQIGEFYDDPEQYYEDNKLNITNEESLVDRTKSMLSRLFDYEDEADFSMFGVDLGAVESVWDTSIRHLTGAYDLLNLGFGGIISAMPGGVQTLSYDELSAGRSVGEILSGKMQPGDAPSPGQIALTSIGLEAARIRNGGARASDILLANPATAPFILAALKAESSPLQQEGFDLLDPEQREAAFDSGYEKWFSGITDFGLAFADPLIIAGVGAKVVRAGMIGAGRGSGADRAALDALVDNAITNIDTKVGRNSAEEAATLINNPQGRNTQSVEELIDESIEYRGLPRITPEVEAGYDGDFIADFLDRVSRVDKNGQKVMDPRAILEELPVSGTTQATDVADILYRSQSYYEAGMIVKALNGNKAALEVLTALRPALGDEAYRLRRQQKAFQIFNETQKRTDAHAGIKEQRNLVESRIVEIEDELRGMGVLDEDGFYTSRVVDPDVAPRGQDLIKERQRLDKTADELAELDLMVDGHVPDPLNPGGLQYKADLAGKIVDDVVATYRRYDPAEINWLYEGGLDNRFWFASKNNPYSRMVMDSRARRAKAKYQYAVEGSSWLPHKVYKGENAAGEAIFESDGWMSKSMFEGTSRIRRGLRIWRWAGTETPSGYIGLKGTATVGSEREFKAAVNLDIYKGEGVKVGDEILFGEQRLSELYGQFAQALNNPNVDSAKVLNRIEDEIAKDLMRAYGITSKEKEATRAVQTILRKARRERAKTIATIKDERFFVDPDTGTVNKAPFLESQLANGTYMLPFRELERIAQRLNKTGGQGFREKLSSLGYMAAETDAIFQSLWRPATLLRLSYTQRNALEGIIRSAVHEVSMRPFTWPVVAPALGVRNAVMKRVVEKRTASAAQKISTSASPQELQVAFMNEYAITQELDLYQSARSVTIDNEKFYTLVQPDGTTTRITATEHATRENELIAAKGDAEAVLSDVLKQYEADIKGTRFAQWREKNLEALDAEKQATEEQLNILNKEAEEFETSMLNDPAGLKQLEMFNARYETLQILDSQIGRKREMLRYDAQAGLAMYQQQAGRARRIGSGTSIGPDGTFHGDAFAGPLAQINRDLLSSDTTVKQRLQVVADAYGSLFQDVTARRAIVEWNGGRNVELWSESLGSFIEQASSSWVIQRLVLNNGDFAKTVQDIRRTPEGRQWIKTISFLFGDSTDPDDLVYKNKGLDSELELEALDRLVPFANNTPVGVEDITRLDMKRLNQYLEDVWGKVTYATQRKTNPEPNEMMDSLYNLLAQRVRSKSSQVAETATTDATTKQVQAIVTSLPDSVTSGFGPIAGYETISMATRSFAVPYGKLVQKLFRALGTIPEDAIVRGPFYNERFKKTRNMLIRAYMDDNGLQAADKGLLRKKNGRGQPDTIAHDSIVIPTGELNRIYVQAHRRALSDTKEWLYTIDRRTNLGKYGEYAFPFISAAQNAAVVAGKLLWKEPWVAPAIAALWNAPNRLGIEDENGNLMVPMPFEGITEWLAAHPEIPVLGGAVDSKDRIVIPKDGLNVMLPDTGFGLVPRTSPSIVVGASELMKWGMFKQETPNIMVSTMGKENADQMWQLTKDYIFGEGQGMSDEFLSFDKFLPAGWQKIWYSQDEMSRQYGYKYQIANRTENLRYKGGLRDTKPTPEEIAKRATNMLLFDAFGNLGVPTPQAPYPVITRPIVTSPIQELQDWYRQEQARDPQNASQNMAKLFGDWALQSATTKITKNIGGANPSPETVADIKTLDPLIRQVAQTVGDDNLSVLGILVNNRSSVVEYETSAYAWEKATKIPGTNREWREIQSPQQSIAEQQRVAGWAVYSREIDKIDARLASAGYKSYEAAGAQGFKNAKKIVVQTMLDNPDYAGWATDYLDRGGSKTLAAVQTMEAAVQDETFRQLLIKEGKEQLLANMMEYTQQRRNLLQLLAASGHGIEHDNNIMLKTGWANIRQRLSESDVRWADIANRFLTGDDNPIAPGNAMLVEQMERAANNG